MRILGIEMVVDELTDLEHALLRLKTLDSPIKNAFLCHLNIFVLSIHTLLFSQLVRSA